MADVPTCPTCGTAVIFPVRVHLDDRTFEVVCLSRHRFTIDLPSKEYDDG